MIDWSTFIAIGSVTTAGVTAFVNLRRDATDCKRRLNAMETRMRDFVETKNYDRDLENLADKLNDIHEDLAALQVDVRTVLIRLGPMETK